jgi:hypothetical protein
MTTASRQATGTLLLTGLLAGLVAGCGSSGSTQSAEAGKSPAAVAAGGGAGAGTGSSVGASDRATPKKVRPAVSLITCPSSELSVTVDDAQGSAAAGSDYLPIDFENSSASACTLFGFPGVSFVTSAGTQIGAPAARNTGFGSLRVTLEPGQSAHAWLQVANAQNYPSSTCQPTTASALRVYPPGNTAPRIVSQSFAACRSMSTSILAVMPVRAGRGAQSTVP